MRAGGEALVPETLRAALEQLLGERITQVKVIEHSWIARLHPRARAITRRARIYLRGGAREFFADPSLMLHEYCHVIRQWQTGRLTVLRYLRSWLRHGYRNNPFEVEARAFADANAGRLRALLTPATHPSSASRR
jgi:hypothetical protein